MIVRYSFEAVQNLRDLLVKCGAAIDPVTLTRGDPFYVIGFDICNGVTLRHSGTFIGREVVGRTTFVTVHLDGEAELQRLSTNQIGFFPPGDAMVVTIGGFSEIVLRLGNQFSIDVDQRSVAARAAEIARTPCPCGAIHGDGTTCREFPECVIP